METSSPRLTLFIKSGAGIKARPVVKSSQNPCVGLDSEAALISGFSKFGAAFRDRKAIGFQHCLQALLFVPPADPIEREAAWIASTWALTTATRINASSGWKSGWRRSSSPLATKGLAFARRAFRRDVPESFVGGRLRCPLINMVSIR